MGIYRQLSFEVKGVYDLLLHNGQLANPKNEFAKAIKSVTGKRGKTDDDFDLISDLEWLGGLYTTARIGFKVESGAVTDVSGGGQICLPGDGIESVLISGAKKLKLGEKVKSGVIVQGDFPLMFPDMKKPISELFKMDDYRDVRKVRVQKNAVMRTRPIFRDWSVKFTVNYLPDVINQDDVIRIVETAGQIVGMFEYRPKYGRFELSGVEAA